MCFRSRTAAVAGPDLLALARPLVDEAGETGSSVSLVASLRNDPLLPLPHTAWEVLEVAALFASGDDETTALQALAAALREDGDAVARAGAEVSGRRFRIALGTRASEAALKTAPELRSARIVHLACHGRADAEAPELSHLVLGRSPAHDARASEDGVLYLRELRELGLSCELLVLSACGTTAGKISRFEGITGLSRAGLAAGAGAVLGTLWPVTDSASRELMTTFYGNLVERRSSRIHALGDARRASIRSGRTVSSWSAFVLWDAGG